MATPFDVPPSLFIERLKDELKTVKEISPPEWASYVKTGVHKERPPEQPDWWYYRAASILYQLYRRGIVGVGELRNHYGGRKDRGVRPEHTRKGSGAIIRNALKQLEEANLVKTVNGKGRVISSEGRRLLDLLSTEIKRELEKEIPELKMY